MWCGVVLTTAKIVIKIKPTIAILKKLFDLFATGKHENRQVEIHGYHGEQQPGNGADSEIEPEHFLRTVREERQETEYGGKNGQKNRIHLVIEGFHIATKPVRPRGLLISTHQIDSGIDDYAAKHHECRKAPLVESKFGQSERQEQSDKRHRNHENDGKRKFQRLKGHREHDIDYRNYQQYQPSITVLVPFEPTSAREFRLKTDRQDFFIHIVGHIALQRPRQLMASDKIVADIDFIRLILLPDIQASTFLYNASGDGKLGLYRIYFDRLIQHMPEVIAISIRRAQQDLNRSVIARNRIFRSSIVKEFPLMIWTRMRLPS